MKKIIFSILFLMCSSCEAVPNALNDGLYYSYWVYHRNGQTKEYPALNNTPEKSNGKYIFPRPNPNGIGDEIYINVSSGVPTFFYTQSNSDGDTLTRGWARGEFINNEIKASVSTVITIDENGGDIVDQFIGDEFVGKKVPLNRSELIPFEKIDDSSFKVDCNKYLDINNYRSGGIPEYSESISGDESVRQSYGGTIFIDGGNICSQILDKNIAPEIKYGWILFKKLK